MRIKAGTINEHIVQMLGPATGTATFLVEIIEVIYQTRLAKWRKETMSINTFWADFALTISNKLKNNSKLSDKEKTDMKKCREQAVKKGFGTS